jgi:hypothetical protein
VALARYFFKTAGLSKATKANFVRAFIGLTNWPTPLSEALSPGEAPPAPDAAAQLRGQAARDQAARERLESDPAARGQAERREAEAELGAKEAEARKTAEHERMAREGEARQKADEARRAHDKDEPARGSKK